MSSKELNILLVGKSGNGKSATANSILGLKAFKTLSSFTSVTSEIQSETALVYNKDIKVVEVHGVGDTKYTRIEDARKAVENLEAAVKMTPQGYNAILLVVKYGERFTEEEVNVVNTLKQILGADFVKNFCVVLVTCGDIFERDNEDDGQTFTEWCSEQSGAFAKLLAECGNRAVLFNNNAKEMVQKENQRTHLLKIIDGLTKLEEKYDSQKFQCGQESRETFLAKADSQNIIDDAMKFVHFVNENLALSAGSQNTENVQRLKALQYKIKSKIVTVVTKDNQTGVYSNVLQILRSLDGSIERHIKLCEDEILKERDSLNMFSSITSSNKNVSSTSNRDFVLERRTRSWGYRCIIL